MFNKIWVILLFPFQVVAWDDVHVLAFIADTNSIIQAQKKVTNIYAVPNVLEAFLENTTFSGKVGAGGTDFQDTPYTAYAGLQFNIPLSSRKEARDFSIKKVTEKKVIDTINSKVMNDLAKLRILESEIKSSEVKLKFFKEKYQWVKDRIDKGYSSEMDKLWSLGEKINAEEAEIAKNSLQSKSQRHKLSRYAGDQWKVLLAYLNGDEKALGSIDG